MEFQKNEANIQVVEPQAAMEKGVAENDGFLRIFEPTN